MSKKNSSILQKSYWDSGCDRASWNSRRSKKCAEVEYLGSTGPK